MIPQILELKNFLSYGQNIQRIDFRNYSLICLSGKNGHGKSALLDAVTWALWGQARKITGAAKADEGLLRLGQTDMMVSLEFLFSGRTYRVRREFTKVYGKPLADLDFEIFDEANNKFISLTDKTIRLTQAKIEQLVGLDYGTFVNSAFLRQGQSNEFSKKSAKDRKQIIATILGLGKYDALQHQALEKVKKFSEIKSGIVLLQDQYAKDIATEQELCQKLAQAQTSLGIVNQQVDVAHKQLQDQRNLFATYQLTKTNITTTLNDLVLQEKRYTESVLTLKKWVGEWRQSHVLMLQVPDLDKLIEEQKQLLSEEQRLLGFQQKNVMLQEQLLDLKQKHQKRYVDIKNTLESSITQQQRQMQRLELEVQHHQTKILANDQARKNIVLKINELQATQATIEKSYARYKEFNEHFAFTRHQFEKRRAYYNNLMQRGNWIKNELKEIELKLQTVNDHSNPACPLCEQLLTIKRKQFLAQQLQEQQKLFHRKMLRVSNIIKKLKDLLLIQHEQMQMLNKQDEDFKQQEQALQTTKQKIYEFEQELVKLGQEQLHITQYGSDLAKNLLGEQKKLEELTQSVENVLANDQQLSSLMQQLQVVEQERQTMIVDQAMLKKIQEQLSRVTSYINQLSNIQYTMNMQQDRKAAVRTLCAELKQLKKNIAERKQYLQQFQHIDHDEKMLEANINNMTNEVMLLVKQKEELLQSIGSLEFEYARLQKVKAEYQIKIDQLKSIDQEIEDYQFIASAMSKNGIQALLIEEAIPEIEQEANALLVRLTDNQAQVFIESLRDLKSGGVRETLDIQIADAAGMRPYEMYSGGEAFRVDFAIRIAIAKLLARRAGTALQTLIIDEGFGSQDEDGLNHMMDCLHAIGSDFSKIIIVSHLTDFKHNFPVHFVVEKGPGGSVVRIEERG